MPSTIIDFEDSTAFERLVLDRLCPVYSGSSSEEIDLRQAMQGSGGVQINLCMVESFSASALESQKLDVMPLLFGAAWKVLDLLVELSLNKAGMTPDRGSEWTIQRKTNEAKNGAGDNTVLTTDKALWESLCAIYAATTEHRHCLVHRLAELSGSPPRLSGKDKSGVPLKALETSELDAFILAAQIAASAVIGGGLNGREEAHLRYELDRLGAHTGRSTLGGLKASKPTIVRMILERTEGGQLVGDFISVHDRAKKCMPSGQFDLLIDIPDESRVLSAKLEDVPRQKMAIDLSCLPTFLSFH